MSLKWTRALNAKTSIRRVHPITTPSATQSEYGTPENLPTSEPGTPTFSYTLSASTHFQTGLESIVSCKMGCVPMCCGYNNSASAIAVNYRVKVNGNTAGTGATSTTAASQYWTILFYGGAYLRDVSDGDVIDIYLWGGSTSGDLDLRGKGFYCNYSAIYIGNKPEYLGRNVIINGISGASRWTIGNPSSSGGFGFYSYRISSSATAASTSFSYNFLPLTFWGFGGESSKSSPHFYSYMLNGGSFQASKQTSSSYYPYSYTEAILTEVSWED